MNNTQMKQISAVSSVKCLDSIESAHRQCNRPAHYTLCPKKSAP